MLYLWYQAIDRLLKANSSDGSNIELAIEAVGAAQDDNLTEKVVDFLTGEVDGVPKVLLTSVCKWFCIDVLRIACTWLVCSVSLYVSQHKEHLTRFVVVL